MGNIGRMMCVALPFLLTLGSLISMLVAGLAGVTNQSLYLFAVNTSDFSISTSSITSLISSKRSIDLSDRSLGSDRFGSSSSPTSTTDSSSSLASAASAAAATATSASDVASAVSGTNVTADDLGLYDVYYVSLWNYCDTIPTGGIECKKAHFNWASNATASFTATLSSVASASSNEFTLPDTISTAMDTFSTVTKWTEVAFIIAYIALGLELVLGALSNCSRALSCLTFIVSGIATVAVCAAAALSTAMAAVIVGVVEGTAKYYGVSANMNTNFLAAVWIGAAFAIAAGFFWMFTMCCCKPDHNSSRGRTFGGRSTKHLDDPSGEKALPIGAYQPLHEPEAAYGNQQMHGAQGAQYGAPRYPQTQRTDMAYEPYSHRS